MSEPKVKRRGAYVIKAAEGRPKRVPSRTDGPSPPMPTEKDRTLARALRRAKQR